MTEKGIKIFLGAGLAAAITASVLAPFFFPGEKEPSVLDGIETPAQVAAKYKPFAVAQAGTITGEAFQKLKNTVLANRAAEEAAQKKTQAPVPAKKGDKKPAPAQAAKKVEEKPALPKEITVFTVQDPITLYAKADGDKNQSTEVPKGWVVIPYGENAKTPGYFLVLCASSLTDGKPEIRGGYARVRELEKVPSVPVFDPGLVVANAAPKK